LVGFGRERSFGSLFLRRVSPGFSALHDLDDLEVPWTTARGILVATLHTALLQARCVTGHEAVADAVSDIVAVLSLFAMSHGPRVPRKWSVSLGQLRDRAANVAGVVITMVGKNSALQFNGSYGCCEPQLISRLHCP
jgi:hypothetical protein